MCGQVNYMSVLKEHCGVFIMMLVCRLSFMVRYSLSVDQALVYAPHA